MSDEFPTRRSIRHNAKKQKKSTLSRVLKWGGIGLGVLLVGVVGWVGVRGLIAKNELESALPLVSQLKDSLKSVDLDGAQATVATVTAHTGTARAMTTDPVWWLCERIPLVGVNLSAFRELAGITDDIATGVLAPVSSLGDTLDPKALKPKDGRIDPALFAAAIPVVGEARTNLESAYAAVQAVDTAGALKPIADAQKQLEGMLKPLIPLVKQADEFVALLPGLLGADGPRNYLVVFQNNSEARALGGHAGSWVQVSVDDGKIDLAQQSSVFALKTGGQAVLAIDQNVRSLWAGAAQDPSNVTLVPRLELSAQTAQAFWKNTFGVTVDAVFFIDPVALGYLIDATGPITVPTGDVIDGDNASQFLLNGVYLKYPLNADQDIVFDSIAKLMFGAITKGDFDPKKLVSGALKAGGEHRLLTWFFSEDEEKAFMSTPFNLNTPLTDDKTATFGVYITDNLGSKMTYYVDAKVDLAQAQCAAGTTQYQVKVTITNTVKPEDGPNLPSYVGRNAGGAFRILVTLYAPPGSSFLRDQAAGWDSDFITLVGSDGDYPVMTQRVTLNAGQTMTGTYVMTAPDDVARKLAAYVTPLAKKSTVTTVKDYTC